jgi:hypothetical protein
MAQDKNSNQQRSFLANLIAGGATGNASPYDYERSMFAQRPQAAAAGGGRGANVPVPIDRPDPTVTGSVTPASTATSPSSLIQSPVPPQIAAATSPSSLIQSPIPASAQASYNPFANATSPSSLLQSPPGLFGDAATATSPSSLMSNFQPGVTAGMLNGQPAAAASGFNRPGWTLLPNGTYAKIPYSSRGFGGQ